jgi:hypothetical protein
MLQRAPSQHNSKKNGQQSLKHRTLWDQHFHLTDERLKPSEPKNIGKARAESWGGTCAHLRRKRSGDIKRR